MHSLLKVNDFVSVSVESEHVFIFRSERKRKPHWESFATNRRFVVIAGYFVDVLEEFFLKACTEWKVKVFGELMFLEGNLSEVIKRTETVKT